VTGESLGDALEPAIDLAGRVTVDLADQL